MKLLSYRQKFENYAPEFKKAFELLTDEGILSDLDSSEVTNGAFLVCEAFTELWTAWHGGQSSRLYALGSCFEQAFNYRPTHISSEMEEEGSQIQEVYACLCAAFDVPDEARDKFFKDQ